MRLLAAINGEDSAKCWASASAPPGGGDAGGGRSLSALTIPVCLDCCVQSHQDSRGPGSDDAGV